MNNKYRISQEQNDWVVSIRKSGLIIAYFNSRDDAAEYLAAQQRADEQSKVLGDFNSQQLLRELAAEIF